MKSKARKNQPTAGEVFAARKTDIGNLLDLIGQEIKVHAEEAGRDPKNWGHAGSLGHVRENLVETLQFLILHRFENSEEKAAKFIEDHLAEMREE